MADNCMICGKHLSSRLAKTEGVGPECKHGFSRKIRYCTANEVSRDYIEALFDELEYDIVVTGKEVWWQTDEAPYFHSITHSPWQAPKVLDDECNVTVTSLEELLKMFGYKKIPDVPHPRYIGITALQNLHTHDREPFWFSIFDAKELDLLEPAYDWRDEMEEVAYMDLEGEFFPDMWYGTMSHHKGLHRLFSMARAIGGSEGSDALDEVLAYQDETAEHRTHEMEMCRGAFERGDLYWGEMENMLAPINRLYAEIEGRVFTPQQAEEVMLRVIPEFPKNGDTAQDYFDPHHANLPQILKSWVNDRDGWHKKVKGLNE